MKRLFSLLLIGIFSAGILEAPPAAGYQAKSCCCTVQGQHCKFAKHLHCPLENQAGESGTKAAVHSTAQDKTVLNPFGCGSREEHAASPSYSKEFCNDVSVVGYFFETPKFLIRQPAPKFVFLSAGRIDRPPISAHAV